VKHQLLERFNDRCALASTAPRLTLTSSAMSRRRPPTRNRWDNRRWIHLKSATKWTCKSQSKTGPKTTIKIQTKIHQKNDPRNTKNPIKLGNSGPETDQKRHQNRAPQGLLNPPKGMIDIPHKKSSDGVSTIGTKKYGRRAT
jgi:hypothetical protein